VERVKKDPTAANQEKTLRENYGEGLLKKMKRAEREGEKGISNRNNPAICFGAVEIRVGCKRKNWRAWEKIQTPIILRRDSARSGCLTGKHSSPGLGVYRNA